MVIKLRRILGYTLLFCVFAVILIIPVAVIIRKAVLGLFTGPNTLDISVAAAFGSMKLGLVAACAQVLLGFSLGALLDRNYFRYVFDLAMIWPLTIPAFVHLSILRLAGIRLPGVWQSVLPLTIAGFPIAYFAARFALRREQHRTREMCQLYMRTSAAFYYIKIRPLMRICPQVMALAFVLTISDPLTPTLAGGKVPNGAKVTWIGTTVLHADNMVSQTALLLTIPSLVFATILYKSTKTEIMLGGRGSEERDVTFAPSHLTAPLLVTGAILLLAFTAFEHAGAVARSSWGVIANTLWLVALAALAASGIALAGAWLRCAATDIAFLALLLTPGATLGAGFTMSYGSFAGGSPLLIVFSYLTVSMPLTYLAAIVTRSSRFDSADTAIIQGMGRGRAVLLAVRPHVRTHATVAVAVVTAVSAVMVAPISWVTSPDSPIVVPRLFRLLDSSSYADAFSLAVTMSFLQIILLVVARGALTIPILRTRK
ncbi:MAG: hypothetical protein Q4A71_06860 [Actinomycetaceae bacterium]|nr:hypothetical protein [Actinomycetaceae bacterium]